MNLYLLPLLQLLPCSRTYTKTWLASYINFATSHRLQVIIPRVILLSAPYRPCENVSDGMIMLITIYVLIVHCFLIIDQRRPKKALRPDVSESSLRSLMPACEIHQILHRKLPKTQTGGSTQVVTDWVGMLPLHS